MAVDKGFRRIVLSLMTLVTISVITVGVYLYFNFKSRSSLPVIVPKEASQMMHFQTRKMRDESGVAQPKFMDSLADFMANASIFSHLESPSDAGISLYSDLIYFEYKQLHCLALSLNSEQRFSMLLDTLKHKGFMGGQIRKETYSYAKILNTPWYIAYKYKAAVLVKPTVESAERSIGTDDLESALKVIFSGNANGLISNANIQNVYDAGAQWLVYQDGMVVGYVFKSGKSRGVVAAGQNVESTAEVFEGKRRAWGQISPENKNETKYSDDGTKELENYFESVYNYLKHGKYGY